MFFMSTKFALDLKVARRKSGLTQQDCAHLLDVNQARVSKLEAGHRLPSVQEICTLSLIYGKSFESLFGSVFEDARRRVRTQLDTMPECPRRWSRFNRNHTLNAISERLEETKQTEYGGV